MLILQYGSYNCQDGHLSIYAMIHDKNRYESFSPVVGFGKVFYNKGKTMVLIAQKGRKFMTQNNTPLSYVTVQGEYRTEYIVDKSRFISTIAPIASEAEAQAFIARINKEFWDATHNCTAFAIGPKQEIQRSSDNGEPSGTAGKPMLEVLKKTGLTNAVIVVTRYFGGIKLGAGGLIRAYSHSAALAVNESPKWLIAPRERLEVTVDYSLYGALEKYLQEEQYTFTTEFTDKVSLTIFVSPEEEESLTNTLTNMTNGQLTTDTLGIEMVQLNYSFNEE